MLWTGYYAVYGLGDRSLKDWPNIERGDLIDNKISTNEAIADYLDTKTAQIDQIIQTINTQIEKLKELRKTPIDDVVTGKIKVTDNE